MKRHCLVCFQIETGSNIVLGNYLPLLNLLLLSICAHLIPLLSRYFLRMKKLLQTTVLYGNKHFSSKQRFVSHHVTVKYLFGSLQLKNTTEKKKKKLIQNKKQKALGSSGFLQGLKINLFCVHMKSIYRGMAGESLWPCFCSNSDPNSSSLVH